MSLLRSAVLIAITAITVTFLPTLLRKQLPVRVDGSVEPGFEKVARVFRSNHEQGLEIGSAFSAYYKGKKVVDLWGGYANAEAEDPWQQDTMSMFYSVTKSVVALCIAVAVDRGHLDYDQKVAYYWPDFAQKGKENITLKQLVNHEAAIPVPSQTPNMQMVKDPDWLGKVLAASEPQWEPGTGSGYHVYTFGWLLSEVLRRADPKHRLVGQFFQDEIARPFGIDFFVGLPKEENYRVADIVAPSIGIYQMLFYSKYRRVALQLLTQPDSLMARAMATDGVFGPPQRINTYSFRSLDIPAVNGFGTARGLAKLFGILANGGTFNGKKLLSKKWVDNFAECTSPDIDLVTQMKSDGYCHGLLRHCSAPEGLNLDQVYGHYGHGGHSAFFDPEHNLAFSYQASLLSIFTYGEAPRYQRLIKALYDSVSKIEDNE
ncbi:beta-lactamase domain-containing protein 2-like [Glandiceps talaboti]